MGEQNYEKARQIVVDGVYRTEQLAKEMVEEKWNSLDKQNKTLQYVSEQLQKVGIQISQEDICNIIKATVGHMNINNH
ncbi:phage holin, LLH family [Clostridium acetobutylicum]|uniref:phage holin, LLH family n=1 Tax=Clostridium acetobutylicum TaxID=1488 RepID=UPI00184D0636|nr:phage holin, LLH family [Clostridium acetobutylicum]NYC92180.1 L-lactate utilization protein LutB [Clostridium acetobutylicum]